MRKGITDQWIHTQTHAVNLVVRAWDDTNMNVRNVTEEILEAL
jgi:hypothetical protein